ncbi:hypothetical protein ACFQZC_21425 [Streptacidiphilus monticola]
MTDALDRKPDLARLATNPLMCSLICALNVDRRGYLPADRMSSTTLRWTCCWSGATRSAAWRPTPRARAWTGAASTRCWRSWPTG